MPRSNFNETWGENAPQFEDPRITEPTLLPTGWRSGAEEDPPEAKWENWWHNRVDSALQEIEQDGALSYDAESNYQPGGRAIASNGVRYRSVSENNTGNEPITDDGTNWVEDPNLEFATAAQEAAYGADDVASTPSGIRQGVLQNSNLDGAKGHYTIPGGMVVNWIRLPQLDAGQSIFFDFDKAYTQAVFHVSLTVMRTSNASNDFSVASFDRTATNLTRTLIRNNSAGARNIEVMVWGV